MNIARANRYLITALALLGAGSFDGVRAHSHDDDDDTVYTADWEEKSDLPEKRSDMTASTVGSKIYIIGGCDDHQVACDWWDWCSFCPSISDEVLVYTPSSDSFSTSSAAMPRARYRHAAAVVDTDIWVFGGRDINDTLISEVDVLDTTTMTWSTPSTAAWANPRSDEGAFYYSSTGMIYVSGGYNYTYGSYASTDLFDPSTETWTYSRSEKTIASMNEARGDFTLVEVDDKFYAFGGWGGDWCNPLNSTEVYDPETDVWTVLADLQAGRGDKACGTLNGRVFAIGGEHNKQCAAASTPVRDVEVYDPDHPGRGWVVESHIPEEKFRFASATYDGTIFVFGGQANVTEDCAGYDYCFPVTNHTWAFTETGKSKSSGRRKMPLVVVVIVVLFFGIIAFFSCVGFAKSEQGQRLLGNAPSSSEVPVDEPKDGVEISSTALATDGGDNSQI